MFATLNVTEGRVVNYLVNSRLCINSAYAFTVVRVIKYCMKFASLIKQVFN